MYYKDSNCQFDVPISSFFGAELCDLISLYTLSKPRHFYSYKDEELYRDDGFAIISRISNQELERLKKNTIINFNELGCKITIDKCAIKCNFLDTANNTFKPY